MRSRICICILFIFSFWLGSTNSAKAQGGDATAAPPTVKKTTKPKKAATVKPSGSSKTNTAKQTPKSNNSSLSKSGVKTPNKTKSAASDKTDELAVLGGVTDKPLTLAQILTGLQTQGKTFATRTFEARNQFIAARVLQRGVAFELTEEREQDLRNAGATDDLINIIQAMSVAKLKPKGGVEVTELKNPNDGQIEITQNTGGLRLIQYFIFLLTNASNGLFIGTEEELKHSARCEFEGGGTNCKVTDLVAYKKLLGPFATYEEAQVGLCRSITETKSFPLGTGLKGRWLGSDNWYGLWDVGIDDCSSQTGGKQTEAQRQTNKIGGAAGSIIESVIRSGNGAAVSTKIAASGRWSGSWENSRGESGSSTINIYESVGGAITGDEDGWAIENGRRTGNVLTWEYRNQNDGCRDYKVRVEISADGTVAKGEYEVSDRCEKLIYKGKYIDYRKQ